MIEFTASDRFLVTGASSGIGRACALELHARGATVVLVARREHELRLIREQSSAPERMVVAARDLARDVDHLPEFVRSLSEGRLRGMVCAAGVFVGSPLRVMNLNAARSMIELNVYSTLSLLSGFAQQDVAQPNAAAVLISSVSSFRGLSGASGYGATKGALDALCRSSAAELARDGRRINAILPAVVQTDLTDAVSGDQLSWMRDLQLVPGPIAPEDIAKLAAFLVSDRARSITGQCIAVDGGCGLRLKSYRVANV